MHGPEIEFRWEARFSVSVQFVPVGLPASNVYRVFLGVKQPGRGVDHLPPLRSRLRIVGATPPPPLSVPAQTCHGATFTLHIIKCGFPYLCLNIDVVIITSYLFCC